MPHADSISVGHVVLTDHRILRRPGGRPAAPPAPWTRDALSQWTRFHPSTGDAAEDRRDYALALMESARTRNHELPEMELQRKWFSEAALPLLRDAVVRHPEDVPAREAKAYALWTLGRLDEARVEFESTLEQAPQREDALEGAARMAELSGRLETALNFAERLVRVNPWSWEHRHQLANLLAENRQWRRAAEECDKALALNPWAGTVRPLRIRCLLAVGEKKEAEAELHRLLPMVADPQALRRWFAEQANQTEPRPSRREP
jgi:tetratricopeptide (TPR) repeat protein